MEVPHKSFYDQVKNDISSRRYEMRFSWSRCIQWLVSVIFFIFVSSFALSIALGYRINWSQLSFEQTSIIELNGPLTGSSVKVVVNGDSKQTWLPIKLDNLDPDTYTIQVEKNGYSSWQQTVALQPNQRLVFQDVFLTYTHPTITKTSLLERNDIKFSNQDTRGLSIKHGNELWVDGKFITRTSSNLYNAQWMPQHRVVTLQSGSEIVMIDPVTTHEQILVTLPTQEVVSYYFTDGGRVLTYRTIDDIWQTELYERSSLLDYF